MPELKSIPDVEIFAAGTWNGDHFTTEDLDQIVDAYEQNKDKLKPHLKLGHTAEQKMLQKDGLPAAGWVGRMRRVGDKLMADFIDIPDKIYNLIQNKAFRKVSSEIFFNIDINGKRFPKMLSAVALLGQDMPAVTTLSDILALYDMSNYHELKSYGKNKSQVYEYTYKEVGMSEEKTGLTDLEQKIEALEEEKAALIAEKEELQKDFTKTVEGEKQTLDNLSKEIEDLKKENFSINERAQVAELDAYLTGLKDVSPAMKPYAMELLGPEKKEYSIKDEKLGKRDLFEKILKLKEFTSVNLDESSEEGTKEKGRLQEIDEYMKANSCDYRTAYVALAKEEGE